MYRQFRTGSVEGDLAFLELCGEEELEEEARRRASPGRRVSVARRPTGPIRVPRPPLRRPPFLRPPYPRPPFRPPRVFGVYPYPYPQPVPTDPSKPSDTPSQPPPGGATGGAPEPAGPTPAEAGSEYVRWIQSALNQVMGLRLPIDGIMSLETRSAICDFQRREGLPVDGIVGPETKQALIAARKRLTSPAEKSAPSDKEFVDELWEGEVNRRSRDYIRWVQQALNRILGLGLAEDGILGSQSRSAIRAFQKRYGLNVDGIVGPQTERALIVAGAGPPAGVPPASATQLLPQPSPPSAFRAILVEHPGGGRIKDKTPPNPSDVVTVAGVGGRTIQLHRLAARAWEALVSAARAEGLREPLLLPTSGYRSPEHQGRLWQEALKRYGSPEEARKWVAPPGSSPHQTGRAIDFYLGGKNSSANVAQLRSLPAYKWLVTNARRFGFYPYDREPWHWEYNPPAAGLIPTGDGQTAQTGTSAPAGTNMLVDTPLPGKGPGFYSYVGAGHRYGRRQTIQALQSIASAWHQAHPGGPRIGIGDISLPSGGRIGRHKSHQAGLDVDIRLMRNDATEKPVRYQDAAYSRALTQELVNRIINNGILRVQYIFFNDPQVRGVRKWPGHDNHLHVRFYAPGSSSLKAGSR